MQTKQLCVLIHIRTKGDTQLSFGLDTCISFHMHPTLCVLAVKALGKLPVAISTKFSCAGSVTCIIHIVI